MPTGIDRLCHKVHLMFYRYKEHCNPTRDYAQNNLRYVKGSAIEWAVYLSITERVFWVAASFGASDPG